MSHLYTIEKPPNGSRSPDKWRNVVKRFEAVDVRGVDGLPALSPHRLDGKGSKPECLGISRLLFLFAINLGYRRGDLRTRPCRCPDPVWPGESCFLRVVIGTKTASQSARVPLSKGN